MNDSCRNGNEVKLRSPRNDFSTLSAAVVASKTTAFSCSLADSPADECGLFDGDPQSFLSEGNKHFIYKRYSAAITQYTEGLARTAIGVSHFLEEKKKVEADGNADAGGDKVENAPRKPHHNSAVSVYLELLSNRALTYLSIGNFSAALQDTGKILTISPTHVKGIIRQAKALAGLRRYETAISFLKGAIAKCKENRATENLKELSSFVEKLARMKQQSETGDFYEISQIIEKPYEQAPAEWVDYTGPVKVCNIEGKGRGLRAKEDLPAGTLVCACRAFEIIFLGQENNPEEGISEESKKALGEGNFKVEDDATLNLLARRIYDTLIQNPEKRAEFYQLHAGNDLGHLEPPQSSTSSDDDKAPPTLDMARVYGICRTNAFANSGDSYPEVEKSVGLWIFPAFVNHQCVGGNSTWKIFSDFLFVRTCRPVKKGDEILVSYVSPAFPFRARTEVLTKRLGFVCSCVLCDLDRALPPSSHQDKDRLKLLVLNQEVKFAQLDHSDDNSRKAVDASILLLEQIVGKLEKLQPKHGIYNASLLDPLQKLGLKYFGVGEFQKMIKVMERACALMKSCMLPHGAADASLWIIAAYMQMGNFKFAKKWGKVLRDNLILAYGDVQVLKVLGPWIIDPMTKWGLVNDVKL